MNVQSTRQVLRVYYVFSNTAIRSRAIHCHHAQWAQSASAAEQKANNMDLRNKSVVYVGGFGGIGFASCKCFLEHGVANLAVLDVANDLEKLTTLQAINAAASVCYIKLDLTESGDIERAFNEAHEALGRFDVVVNGSGIMNEPQIERTVQINLLGVIHSTFAALRYMDKSKGGNGGLIVNVSSLVALDAYGAYAVYTATKYGVNGFTRAMADPFYYAQTQVGYITICPSTTETPMLQALRVNPVTTFERKPPLPKSLCNEQTAEVCGQNLVNAVKTAKNGSFWMLCGGELKEYVYPEI